MYIICPECTTKFIVNDAVVFDDSARSKKFKCIVCNHIWSNMYNNDINDLKVNSLTQGQQMSELKSDDRSIAMNNINPTAKKASVVARVYLAILFTILSITALAHAFSEKLITSLCVSRGIVLHNVSVDHDSKNKKIVVNYQLYNNTSSTTPLPIIVVSIKERDNQAIQTHFVREHSELKSHGSVNINTQFEGINLGDVSIVDIGLLTPKIAWIWKYIR